MLTARITIYMNGRHAAACACDWRPDLITHFAVAANAAAGGVDAAEAGAAPTTKGNRHSYICIAMLAQPDGKWIAFR